MQEQEEERESCETRLFTKCPSHRILNTAKVLLGGRKKNNFHKTQISRAHKRKANKQTNTHTHTKFVREADKSELPKGIPQECLRDRVCPDLSPRSHRHKRASQPASHPVSLVHTNGDVIILITWHRLGAGSPSTTWPAPQPDDLDTHNDCASESSFKCPVLKNGHLLLLLLVLLLSGNGCQGHSRKQQQDLSGLPVNCGPSAIPHATHTHFVLLVVLGNKRTNSVSWQLGNCNCTSESEISQLGRHFEATCCRIGELKYETSRGPEKDN